MNGPEIENMLTIKVRSINKYLLQEDVNSELRYSSLHAYLYHVEYEKVSHIKVLVEMFYNKMASTRRVIYGGTLCDRDMRTGRRSSNIVAKKTGNTNK